MKRLSMRLIVLSVAVMIFCGSNPGFCKTISSVKVQSVAQTNGCNTTVFTAGGQTSPGYYLSNSNSWTDFAALSITISLTESTAIIAHSEISMFSDFSHLVTRLMVDNAVVSKTINGENAFWSNSNQWFGMLPVGEHTIKVQYRTPKGGHSNPINSDLNNRVLQVMVMGHADVANPTVLTAGGPDAPGYDMSNTNTWTDFPDLSLTFSLSESTAVMTSFHIALFSDFSALVTRIVIDNAVVSKTITGENAFWDNSNQWMGVLAPGQHTVKV
ncbi:MAG: hypothetical protein GY757_04195 [bacterium]|nr:hypothetical protein [bacterium]